MVRWSRALGDGLFLCAEMLLLVMQRLLLENWNFPCGRVIRISNDPLRGFKVNVLCSFRLERSRELHGGGDLVRKAPYLLLWPCSHNRMPVGVHLKARGLDFFGNFSLNRGSIEKEPVAVIMQ